MPLLISCAGPSDTFTPSGVLSGASATAAECAALKEAVWVEVQGKGDCIRYFSAGLAAQNPVVLVFFQGDNITRHTDANGNTKSLEVIGYDNVSPARTESQSVEWSAKTGLPYIFVGRPGTYGSSGDHKDRRLEREVLLVDAALERIKATYHVDRFALAGQSSGGHLVGAMLAKRSDIACAVPSSGVTAVRKRIEYHHWSTDATGYMNYWDPYDHVGEIARTPGLRIFVIGDESDSNVPYVVQKAYYEKLKAAGLDAYLGAGHAIGSEHHGLGRTGITAAGWCAAGMPADEILRRVQDLRG